MLKGGGNENSADFYTLGANRRGWDDVYNGEQLSRWAILFDFNLFGNGRRDNSMGIKKWVLIIMALLIAGPGFGEDVTDVCKDCKTTISGPYPARLLEPRVKVGECMEYVYTGDVYKVTEYISGMDYDVTVFETENDHGEKKRHNLSDLRFYRKVDCDKMADCTDVMADCYEDVTGPAVELKPTMRAGYPDNYDHVADITPPQIPQEDGEGMIYFEGEKKEVLKGLINVWLNQSEYDVLIEMLQWWQNK